MADYFIDLIQESCFRNLNFRWRNSEALSMSRILKKVSFWRPWCATNHFGQRGFKMLTVKGVVIIILNIIAKCARNKSSLNKKN